MDEYVLHGEVLKRAVSARSRTTGKAVSPSSGWLEVEIATRHQGRSAVRSVNARIGHSVWIGDAAERGERVRDRRGETCGEASLLVLADGMVERGPVHGWQPGGDGSWLFEQIFGAEQGPLPITGWLQAIFMQVTRAQEDEFNEWYEDEHIHRLSTVPGFVSVRRYRTPSETPTYLALWNVTDPSVLTSGSWRQQAETPWTRRMRRFMTNRVRYICQPMADVVLAEERRNAGSSTI